MQADIAENSVDAMVNTDSHKIVGTDFHNIVFICAVFVIICVYCDVVVDKRVTVSRSEAVWRKTDK